MMRMGEIVEMHYAFGVRVKQLRKELCLTQQELGSIIGIERSSISRLETGNTNATFDTILRLAYGLGLSPSELLAGIEMHTTLYEYTD